MLDFGVPDRYMEADVLSNHVRSDIGMPCGKRAVAKCADCREAICSDCSTECCGDSFCGQCNDYHVTHSCVRKPV